jgi:hypothetical protein
MQMIPQDYLSTPRQPEPLMVGRQAWQGKQSRQVGSVEMIGRIKDMLQCHRLCFLSVRYTGPLTVDINASQAISPPLHERAIRRQIHNCSL